MNCREHQEFFSDLYDGNLPADRRRDLEAHLASCPECRAEYEDFSSSLHALREGAVPVPGEPFVRRIVQVAKEETERLALYQNTGLRRPTTRRSTAPKRAVWAVPAVAAAALVAFAVGFLVQKHAGDQQIRELKDQLARTRPEVPVRIPDRTPVVTNQEIIAQFLKEKNIVEVDGALMSAEIRDRLAKGEMKVGDKWTDSKKEIERLVAEEISKSAGPIDVKAAEAKVFETHGLVRRGDWIIPRKWADALDAGHLLDSAGEPRDLAELVRDKFRDLGLVEHDGKWMRPEEKAVLVAARRIHNPGAAVSAVTRGLDGVEIGAPAGFRNLLIYPLIGSGDRTLAVSSLPDAMAADRVEITDEVSPLQALTVRVRNKGDADLALLAGEILVGGRHARVVARDTIVPAKKDRTIEVFDVEPAELRAADRVSFRKESGALWAPLGLRRVLNEEAGQGAVWASSIAYSGRLPVADLYKDHRSAIQEFRTALNDLKTAHPNLVGLATAVGDSLASVEVFGTPALFAANFDRVLESAVIEAISLNQRETRFPSDLSGSPVSVKRLAENAFGAELDAEGDAFVLRRNGRILGRALATGGEPVRIVLFPDGPPTRPALDVAISQPKLLHVLKAYEARLQANGPRRSATLREIAMLPGERPREMVLSFAKPGSPLRREAIEALGLRSDPATADQLVKWLKESRKDVPMYSTLAQSLTRLGSEEAVAVLISDIDPKSIPLSRAACEYLPGLMSAVRDLNTLETSMGTLIAALQRIPPESAAEPQGGSWSLKTLRVVTGRNFVGPTDYLNWWSDAVNRREFLEQRRK